MKGNLRIVWFIAAFLALATCFQNCSGCSGVPLHFSSNSQSPAPAATDSGGGIVGNGEPIDGKPDPGVYYRLIPGFKCQGKSTLAGRITVTDSTTQVSVIDPATCTLLPRAVTPGSLETAKVNRNYVSFESGLFEKIAVSGSSAPNPELKNFAVSEAWCRSEPKDTSPSEARVEVAVQQDLSTRLLTASIATSDASGSSLTVESLRRAGTRNASVSSVTYSNGDFSLEIDLASASIDSDGMATGRLRAKIAQASIDKKLSCRTAARFDPISPLSPPVFRILGVTGDTDGDIDEYLTSGTSATVHWQPVNEASSYRIALIDKSSRTEVCAKTFPGDVPTSQAMTGCTLAANSDYLITVSVTTVGGQTISAANDGYEFGLRQTPCPIGYVRVPALLPYTTKNFCIAKFEAKRQGTIAVSSPNGIPWVNVNRDEALFACRANGSGFDLISNAEWQSVARNIESTPDNWSGGAPGIGTLNIGNADGAIGAPIAASPDDTLPCTGNDETCGLHGFNSKKRTLTLANGSIVWDLSGNVWEWTRDDNFVSYGANGYMNVITNSAPFTNQAKDRFGPAGSYPDLNVGSRGGLGYALINANSGGIVRGSYWDGGAMSGVFRADTSSALTARTNRTGFRCVYHLP